MDRLPPPAPGFVRIAVHLRPGLTLTPGELATRTGLGPDLIGHASVLPGSALIDVRMEHGRQARATLESLGQTRITDWEWRWLRLSVGRNHGLVIGQLRKIMQNIDAVPLGRIAIANTHALVGIQDFRIPSVLERLSRLRINGYAPRAEILPPGKGPGSAAFQPAM
jgi:hypothetical protein